jgi:predicted NUDIX family NTP pyrophosphohydrolase
LSGSVEAMSDSELEPTQWKIFGERLVDENPFIRLSIASVELPDGTEFEQYVMRMRRTATTAVVNDHGQVLPMWRHRFIIDRWVWEMPGGYVDQAEDPAAAAAREVEEETGWRLSEWNCQLHRARVAAHLRLSTSFASGASDVQVARQMDTARSRPPRTSTVTCSPRTARSSWTP